MSTITRIPSHVLTASSEGMKAGFRQFEAASSKSGLGPVKALWSEFEALTAKPRFNLYCSMFGPAVDELQSPVASVARSHNRVSNRVKNASAAPVQEDRKMTEIQKLVEAANALLAKAQELTDAETADEAPVKNERVITPADPKAPVTYKQAMTLRFRCGLTAKQVDKLNQGQASKKIAAFYAAA